MGALGKPSQIQFMRAKCALTGAETNARFLASCSHIYMSLMENVELVPLCSLPDNNISVLAYAVKDKIMSGEWTRDLNST